MTMERPPEHVSCRHLGWIFEVSENIDPVRLIRDVDLPLSHLLDSAGFIDWQSYGSILANLGKYLDEDHLLAAGKQSWASSALSGYALTGRNLFSVREQYLEMFGPLGTLTTTLPVSVSIKQTAVGQIRLELKMKSGLNNLHTFHLILAGQLVGLPISMGRPAAQVSIESTEQGAVFDITFTERESWFSSLWESLRGIPNTVGKLHQTLGLLNRRERDISRLTNQLGESRAQFQELESRYQLIANNVSDIIWVMDVAFSIRFVSPAVLEITGYTDEEIVAMDLSEILEPRSLTKALDLVNRIINDATGASNTPNVELEIIRKDGTRAWLELRASLNRETDPATLIGIARDITERKNILETLRERETSYQLITNTAQDAIITLSSENIITFANPASVEMFGFDLKELIGMKATSLLPESLGDHQLKALFSQKSLAPQTGVILKAMTKDRRLIPLEMSYTRHPIDDQCFTTCIIRDITARSLLEAETRKLEQQLLASQKMESIGQLTGGIAHDFNNLLVAILGYSDLALSISAPGDAQTEYLKEIKLAGERAADMTQKLLAFSRRQIIEPQLLDANALLTGIESMVRRLLPESINVVMKRAPHTINVMADQGQVEQLLINLAVNARDAMPIGGNLVIESTTSRVDEEFVNRKSFAHPGEYAVISVTDNGSGISEEIARRIFEPFFTTKPEGAGTGLGLSVVFGIVKQHDGFIDLTSTIGEGTRFDIYLPLVREKTKAARVEVSREVFGGSETIFVVEDEPQVRTMSCLMLKGAGYSVIEAIDGVDAVEKFAQHVNDIDLVLMDVVMPRMGGREVMQEMLRIAPETTIIFTSGYSPDGIHSNFILEEGLAFLPKPYTTDALRRRIRATLDESAMPDSHASIEASD